MVYASCGGSFLYKTPIEAWEMFEHFNENSHLHATSSRSNLPSNWKAKRGFYEVSYSIDLSNKVDAFSNKFNQLLCMNNMANSSSMRDVSSIIANLMHASFKCPSVGPSNAVNEQVNCPRISSN